MLACRSSFYQPCLWSYRILDKEAGLYEVVQNALSPKVHVLVTIGPEAQISCTCRSGREGFRRTQRQVLHTCLHADHASSAIPGGRSHLLLRVCVRLG